jgi:hypothetical protein
LQRRGKNLVGRADLCSAGLWLHVTRSQPDRRELHSGDYIHIASASAQISADCFSDLVVARGRILSQECERREQHPRRAEATLQAVCFREGFLDRMQLRFAEGQALNRRQRGSLSLHCKDEA